jgi:hypothetical protein
VGLLIGNPGNKQADPVLGRLVDGNTDARGAVDRRRDPDYGYSSLDGGSIRLVSPEIEPVTTIHLLVQVEQDTRVSVGSLQADPSSARPETTMGKRSAILSAKRLSS